MTIKTREDFPWLIDKLKLKIGVEIGIGVGTYSAYLLNNSKLDILYGVENWGVKGPRRKQESTKKMLLDFGCRYKLIEMNSVDAAQMFQNEYFDFVYIDADHRRNPCYNDLVSWWPKCKAGGFFAGHDYVVARKCGVIKAVDQFFGEINREFLVTEENDNPSFYLIK